ncbi:lysin A [Arthrobacter phage Sonali]|uniref:lysozyme n=1 Tax=Arthrobacter phage Sonali TaxID=2510495 RepID=A0A411CQD4_9CAUD|nr:endolysin [Arthrobacter phage Sonali]QAY16135.1 lysin A [Arthrobacter phage Sonali]
MSMYGIDVSSWQSDLDINAVKADFVIVKATGGTGYVNPACVKHVTAAKKRGLPVGIYHFAHEQGFQGSAVAEAQFFLSQVRGFLDGQTLLVLDWEGDNDWDTAWAKTWLDTVFKATGVRPLIYLNGHNSRAYDWSAVINANYGLWYAEYAVTTPTQGYVAWDKVSGAWEPASIAHCPAPAWGKAGAVMWQFADHAMIPGYGAGLDANVFYGDRNTWAAYCRKAGAPAPAPAAPKPVQAAPKPAVKPAPKPAAKPVVKVGANQVQVKAGESMSAIARARGFTLAAMIAANPQVPNPNIVHVGQVLNLPVRAAAAAPAQVPYCWVTAGDTLSGIAKQFGKTLAYVIARNPGINPDLIYPGQRINL